MDEEETREGARMEKTKTIEEVLGENGLAFSPNMEAHYMKELEGIWNDACAESGR